MHLHSQGGLRAEEGEVLEEDDSYTVASGQLYVQVAGLLEEEQRSLVVEELGYIPCEEYLLPGEDAAADGLWVEVVGGVVHNVAVEA